MKKVTVVTSTSRHTETTVTQSFRQHSVTSLFSHSANTYSYFSVAHVSECKIERQNGVSVVVVFLEEKVWATLVENVQQTLWTTTRTFGIVKNTDECHGLLIEVHVFRLLMEGFSKVCHKESAESILTQRKFPALAAR